MKRGYFDATDVWYLMTTMEIPGLSAEASSMSWEADKIVLIESIL